MGTNKNINAGKINSEGGDVSIGDNIINTVNIFISDINAGEQIKGDKISIHSKPLISELDINQFTQRVELDSSYYEPRYLGKENSTNSNFQWRNNGNSKTLYQSVFEFDKIILLGSPGIGKTRELDELFNTLWKEKENKGLIPFHLNLRNFRTANKFEDLIMYKKWTSLTNIIFILDGLDEIADIQNFISALEVFIHSNSKRNIKYVISCRTNIYQKYLVKIVDFEIFKLEYLTFTQAKTILENKYGITTESLELEPKHYNYLQTPFFLNLFANYFLVERKPPQNDSSMWELYVKTAMKRHKEKLIKRIHVLNVPEIRKSLTRVAIINELMQKNYTDENELSKVLGSNYMDFIEYPFIDALKANTNQWSFEHKQIQEYFVANILSEKSFEEIVEIIRIPNISRELIYPSLFNTTSFLINLLETGSAKFKNLIEWINREQQDLLFRADSDRISNELKISVFQSYFNTECIKKRYWISTNRNYTTKEIARFGDCIANFNYLVDFLRTPHSFHFRVLISALDLVSYFELNNAENIKGLKVVLMSLIEDGKIQDNVKASAVVCIRRQEFCKDEKYLKKLFEIFKNETSNEINYALLSLVEYGNLDADEYFAFIKAEFERVHEIIKRDIPDNVLRGNDRLLRKLILRFKVPKHFIEIVSYFFRTDVRLTLDNDNAQEILNKSLDFLEYPDFIIQFFESFNGKTHYHHNDKLLIAIVKKFKKKEEITRYLIANNVFGKVDYFLSQLANSETVKIIASGFLEGSIKENVLANGFRNLLVHGNDDKNAKEFNELMISGGYKFNFPFYDEGHNLKQRQESELKKRANFDLLFNRQELLASINNIFELHENEIDIHKVSQIQSEWYDKNGHWANIDISISIISSFVYLHQSPVSYDMVVKYLNNDFILMKEIKSLIEHDNHLFVSENQKQHIENWYSQSLKTINFDRVITLYETNSFQYGRDFEQLKIILFLHNHFGFQLSQEFLLNCIEFAGLIDEPNEESLNGFFHKVNNKVLFDARVIANINTRRLFSIPLLKHVEYAVNNDLKESFVQIRELIKSEKLTNIPDRVLNRYFELTKDYAILVECTKNINTFLCWSSIKLLLIKNEETEVCKNKAIEFLNSSIEGENYHQTDALGVLFQLKCKEALDYYINMLNAGTYISLRDISYNNYDVIADYNDLERLFFMIFKNNLDDVNLSNNHSFYSSYISNLSKDEVGYLKTKKVLNRIKEQLENNKDDSGLFYVNQQLDNSTNSYINSKSIAMDFNQALKKANELFQSEVK